MRVSRKAARRQPLVLLANPVRQRPVSVLGALRQRCLVGQAMALVLWNAPAFAQNIITPDGRTQTNVAVSGATTTITTQTVSGGAGYNSFSRFEQAGGTTVNMHLPQNTGALVNIVRNGPVVVNGILNSYKNGQIGGHVYFSDSAGFTVGPSGVINTGQLTVNTPTREFLDQVIGPNGVVNEGLAARLKANDIPVSPDGAISIEGRINARRGVTLHGHSVSVSGQVAANTAPVDLGERRKRHQTAFDSSVNTAGVRHGGAMVARRGGGIEITAAGTVRISGSLSANATARRSAGSIVVRSGAGTTITQTARLSAQGAAPSAKLARAAATGGATVNTGDGGKISITSDAAISIARGAHFDVGATQSAAGKGGEIKVLAGTNLDVEGGAVFKGKGGLTGDGGFTELSARKTVTLGAVDVDLSARSGKAGLLYIDPTDLIIGTGGSANMITNGTNVSLEATNSITIAADGVVDTRQFNRAANGGVLSVANPSTGISGAITLTAPNISVFGSLLAGVSASSAYQAGIVTLDATKSQTLIGGRASATSTIDIHGTITGKDVLLKTESTAIASYINPSAGPLTALAAQTVAGALLGLNGGYVGSQVLSRIRIVSGASISATNDVSVIAKGKQEASMPAITITGNNVFGGAVSIGEIAGTVTADIASGATISVGRNLEVRAENDVKLGVSAISVTVGTALVAATVAYGNVDVTTSAKVHSGATIATSGISNVSVTALNTNSFSTSATAVAASGGVAGASIAYSDYRTEAEALLGASLGASANKVQTVTVSAISDTIKNATSATTTVGDNLIFSAGTRSTTVSSLLSKIFGKLSSASDIVPVKAGSAVAIADSSLSAKASIAADPGGMAPTIHAAGNVVVASRQRDFGVRLIADSAINSKSKDPESALPGAEAEISLSFGIGVGNYRHDSTAFIGSGTTINAFRVGVGATNEMPISNTWTNWAGLSEAISHLNGNLGVVNNILTSYANASSQSSELGLAGSVSYFRADNNTSAYVASGATINATALSPTWTTTLGNGYVQNWSNTVSVVADTTVHSIDGGGNFGLTGGLNGGAGSAAGGSLLYIGRSSRTIAAIADGATITATGLAVTATTSDKMFVVATSSGRAQGVVLSGMVALAGLNNQTLASISNRAFVTADLVDVKAEQFVSVFSISGALVMAGSGGSAFGVSVGRINATAVTRAYIGDNSDDLSNNRLRGAGTTLGRIATDSLTVQAATTGRLTAASIAAAVVDGKMDLVTDDPFFAAASAASAAGGGGKPSFALAGSAAVASTQLGTSAWIDGARVEAKTTALSTAARALNSTIIEIGSGSAAIDLGMQGNTSAALAGAIAFAKLDNSTDARISRSTLTNIGNTRVQALAGGRATVVGLGLAGSVDGNAAAAMSVALGLVTNRVAASISDSTLLGPSNGALANLVYVNAYQTTDIGIGGGAAFLGAKNGVGLALTYAEIRDPEGQDAVSATVTRSRIEAVDGLVVTGSSASRIVSSAISAGLGPGNGLAGSFVFNSVTPTVRASIDDDTAAPPTIAVSGNVFVIADGSRDSALDAIITGRQLFARTDTSRIDFTGAATNDGLANPTGASILAIAGAVQGGENNVGVSLLSNRIAQSHIATINGARLTATGDVTVRAQDGAIITGIAVGLGVATGKFTGVASVTLQSIDNVVRAGITGANAIVDARDILVSGSASSLIRGTSGSVGLGLGTAAVGLSIVDNSIDNQVGVTIEDARLRASRNVVATAASDARITTLAIGIAISRQAGLAGSVATSSVATDVAATVKHADIIAENNVGVIATNQDGIAVSAGALGAAGGSPSVAGGLSIVRNGIGGSTTASISENSTVDARVNGSGSLAISSGALVSAPTLSSPSGPSTTLPDLAMAQRSVRGLAVIATSQQAVMANAVTAGIAVYPISGAVGYVTIRNDLGGTTLASIDGSRIDTRLNGGQNQTAIVVDAASHSYAGSYVVVGAIGGAAGAGADANTKLKRTTTARLTNSTTGTIAVNQAGVGGVGAVEIAAVSSQASTGKTIGFAVGGLGAAASGLVNSFEAVTTASLDQGILNAASLRVTADSANGFYGVAGVGAGGGVALGSAFVVGRSQSSTLATVGGGANVTTLNLNGRLDVLATGTNRFTALSAGGAAAGIVGVAGMVNLIDVANTTRAGLYGVASTQRRTPIQELAGQSIDGSFTVIARETTAITPATGVAALGGSGIGLGSATNVASLDSSVIADLSGSTISTSGAVSVQAISDRNVDANAFTIGQGGSLGLGAAVNVISVGTGAPADAGLNIRGNGTLSRVNQLTAVDPGFTLSTGGLATYRALRGANASGQTDDQLRATAHAEYLALIQNGTVVNGVMTLTASGVDALRANAATALFQTTPTDSQVREVRDSQVRDYAAARYTALQGANLQYVIGDAGLSSYRQIVQAATPAATDAQVRIAANDAYATLLANGVPLNGLYALRGSGVAVYQAAADAELGRTATFGEVGSYAAAQYAWFTGNRARTATPTAISATALLDSTGSQTGATALGGSITAASVSVTSTSKTSTGNVAKGIGVGGIGVGAALGYTTVADAVSARLDQATVTTGSITVNASALDGAGGEASRIAVTAGAGAGTAAAGAAVAEGSVSNTITARLGGTLTVTGATSVNANTTQASRADALGAAAAGGGALGVSLASSSLGGTVNANIAANATLSSSSLSVAASSNGISYASATAGAGGLLAAGTGADARASDSSRVEAHLGDNASVNVGTGAITVSATATPDAKAAAYGVSVTGGLAVGVAMSRATVNQTVIAALDGSAAAQRALTAGSLSILATSAIAGTPLTSIGGSPGETRTFSRGGTGAAAWSFAGSGAYYASAVGSDARAATTSTVSASAGNNVRLPTGIVRIEADNTTRQIASATGVSIAGNYSIGAVIADARSSATTSATLGDDARLAGDGTSTFSLKATGSDTQIATAVSGSGGLLAGAGASADTANTATVTAGVGARVRIAANTIQINALHTDSYANRVDAVQAAALGASASLASHNAKADVQVRVGDNAIFAAFGNGTRGCYVTSCGQGIALESRNVFTQLALGDTISAGAGGGVNGVGAKSTIGIDGTSKVTLGNDVSFASGGNAVVSPGPIAIQAISELTANDTVTLTTGGLLQGAGVTSQYRADVDNEITLGTGNTLTSAGTVNVGTYTTATVKTNALVTTYGLAAVGVAEADTNIRTDQTITVGANSTLTGLDNVNVTAGRDASGLAITRILGDATAIGYVRGLIAVPDADAATDLQNHARLNIATGAALLSAQNVTLGAYNGTVTPNADGAGHGFQLYFIPVTQRDESPGSAATSTVVMNGRAVGGVFHEQRIIIGCGTNGGSICGTTEQPTVYIKAGGAPVTVTHDPSFNAVAYVRDNYTTFNGTIADTAVADTLVGGVAQGLVRAYRISQLYAAGGNVFVNGDTIQGNGTLTANGGPTITVVNNSAAYLILDGGAYIPDLSTGQILFTGAAQGQNGLTRNTVNANGTVSVIISNAYTRDDVGGYGPALLIAGDVTNLGGLVSINNTQGSFGFSGQRIDALQFNVTVPNGAVAVASNGPSGMYNAGASPMAEWGHAITYPGATPGAPSQNFSIVDTVNAIANTLYFGSGSSLNYNLYHRIEDGGNPGLRVSTIFYGNCIGYGSTGSNCGGNGYTYQGRTFDRYDFGNGINFVTIPIVPKYRESSSVQAQGSGAQIYGAQVAIKASVININASIEAGRVTNRSVTIDQSYANSLDGSRDAYLRAGYSTVRMTDLFPDEATWKAATTVQVSYDFVNRRFIIDDTNASSGGGSVLLDGQIISTNPLGRIKINGGFGHVSVANNTDRELVVNRINTGTAAGANASTSKITIVDRLKPANANTTVYVYTPGSGIAKYITENGRQPILSGANASIPAQFIAGAETNYDTKDGMRYEWTQQLFVYKDGLVSGNPNSQGTWRYSSGSANNPWVYVSRPATGSSSGPDYWNQPSTTPQGRVVHNQNYYLSDPVFFQTLQGGVTQVSNAMQSYERCNGGNPSFCDRDFRQEPGSTANTYWNYNHVYDAWLQVTASVKADYDFGISFGGNASGLVTINSNAAIRQQGNIVNPSGATTIRTTAGGITQAPNISILTTNLTLSAPDAIGAASAPIVVNMTAGGVVTADTGAGGLHMAIDGAARIAWLNAGPVGDVNVSASGGLSVAAGFENATHVTGNNIRLTSRDGGIGAVAALLRIQANAATAPNGSQAGGVVNVTAQGDIGIRQLSGNLRVGQIASTSGNVRVDVVSGTLQSASAQTAAQSLTTDQLSTISSKLKLTQADGADAAAQASVASFERNVTQTYALYSSLIRNGTVAGGVFVLNADAVPLYQKLADAALGGTADETAVRAYAAQRYASYATVFDKAYGASWSSRALFNADTLASDYSFTTASAGAASGLASSITANAVWQTGQLVAAIDQAALQPASGVVGNGTAIVVGRDVTLNIGGSIGSLAPDVTIALDAIRNGTLTTVQLQALAVATTPGSVKLAGTNGAGQRVAVASIETVPDGVTLTSVDIAQTAPLFISATGTFSGSAQGDIYLQATTAGQSGGGSLNLGRVTATGAINLQAPQAITVATVSNSSAPLNAIQIQTGGDLTLSAAGGSIGSAATPLTYQIGGRLVSASAGAGDAYLVTATGNAQIGRVFAQGTASLTATSGSITGYLPGVAVSARTVLLNASGDVGSAGTPFAVKMAADGEISGRIGGSGWLSAPTLANQTAVALRIGALTAANGIALMADAELRILRSLTATTGALTATAGSITMATGATATAAGRITLAGLGDVGLGRVSSALTAPLGTSSIVVTAGGAVTAESGVVNLSATQAGGVVSVAAGTGIGTSASALTIAAPTLSARSLQGDVRLHTTQTARVSLLKADAGAASSTGDAATTIDELTAGLGATATTTAGALTVTTLAAGATSTLIAAGRLTVTSARTSAGNLLLTSTGAGITAGALNAAGLASLAAPGAISVTTLLTSGGSATVTSTGSTLDIATLTAGGAATLSGAGLVTIGSAGTTLGDLAVTSTNGDIAATTLVAAGTASLTATGAISVSNAMSSGGGATVTSSGGTLSLQTVTAGGAATLSGARGVILGSVNTTAGDLAVSSSTGGIAATTLDAAGTTTLTSDGAISVTTTTSGGGASATASAGTLSMTTLVAGGTTTLSAFGSVTLGSARTDAGDLSIGSTTAGVTAATVTAARAVRLTASGAIAVTTALTGGGAAIIASTGDALDLVSVTAGATSTLSGSGAVTLGSVRTTAGDLSVSSGTAGIAATSLNAAGGLSVNAPGAITVVTATSGGGTQVASTTNTLSVTTLTAGATSTLASRDGVTFGSTTTTLGDLAVSSSQGGIIGETLSAASRASLTATGAISVAASLTSGGGSMVATTGGSLGIARFIAGATSSLAASGAITLSSAQTSAGDLSVTSTGAGITASTIQAAGAATVTAAGSISVTASLISGNETIATATGGPLGISTFTGGANSELRALGAIMLGSARTTGGDLSVISTGAGISAVTIDAAGAADLSGAGAIAVTAALMSGGASTATSTGGRLDLASVISGGMAAFSAYDTITLGSVLTTTGNLSAASTVGGITAATVEVGGAVTLAATGAISITGLTSGANSVIASRTGSLTIDTLMAGRDARLSAAGTIQLRMASTADGDFAATAAGAELAIATLRSSGSATLNGANGIRLGDVATIGSIAATVQSGPLEIVSVKSGGEQRLKAAGSVRIARLESARLATVKSTGATIAVTSAAFADKATFSAAGDVILGTMTATGDIVVRSDAGSVSALRLETAAAANIAAQDRVSIETLTSGGVSKLSAGAGGIAVTTLSGAVTSLSAVGEIGLGSATTRSGDFAASSTAAGFHIKRLDAAGAILLQAPGAIAIGDARSGRQTSMTSSLAGIDLGTLASGFDATLSAFEGLRFDAVTAGGLLGAASTRGTVDIGRARAGQDVLVDAQTIIFGAVDAGRSASLVSAGTIDGDAIVATDALVMRAGRSGVGSITIGAAAAHTADLTAPDDVRIDRFGVGDSLSILGTAIASSIVQLPGRSRGPLVLTIAGSREKNAGTVDLSIDAAQFVATRLDAVDPAVRTTARRFDILEASVPGALRLTTPTMSIFANNRSIAPVRGFDVQLYQKSSPFFLGVNDARFTTNAFVVRFDSDVARMEPTDGISLVRDMQRQGTVYPAGPGFGNIARSFVLGDDGRWRSRDRETTASAAPAGGPKVNLGDEAQP